jgi:DNA-3-methyladenine glycosylase
MKKLKRTFFKQSTLDVAKQLIGKILVFQNHKGIITETEAYFGFDDPASHAFRGKTPRTEVMFGEAGFTYVYLIYGMYHCLNFVTEDDGFPAAVLIRGIELINNKDAPLLNGPGKLCKYLGITKTHNNIDITKENDFYVACVNKQLPFISTPRIGIKEGKDKLWRFIHKP